MVKHVWVGTHHFRCRAAAAIRDMPRNVYESLIIWAKLPVWLHQSLCIGSDKTESKPHPCFNSGDRDVVKEMTFSLWTLLLLPLLYKIIIKLSLRFESILSLWPPSDLQVTFIDKVGHHQIVSVYTTSLAEHWTRLSLLSNKIIATENHLNILSTSEMLLTRPVNPRPQQTTSWFPKCSSLDRFNGCPRFQSACFSKTCETLVW